MSTAEEPNSSYESASATHRLFFHVKRKKKETKYTATVNHRNIQNLQKIN